MLEKDNILNMKLDLRKYLNQKTNYSFNNIKKNLDIIDNEDFFYLLLKVLKEDINDLNFETPVYYNKYLFKILNYLNEEIELNNKKYVIEQLDKIKNIINKRITNNKSNTTVAFSNKAFLLSIYSDINRIITKIKNDKNVEPDLNEVYNLLKELIFEIKNPIYIEEILNNFPNLISIKKDNRYLFEEVYDKYLNVLLNRNDDYELLYYDKLVNVFIDASKEEENIKCIVLSRIDKLLSSLDNRELSRIKKEKIKFFLQQIVNYYRDDKQIKDNEIEKLKIKYNLKKITELQKFKLVKPSWKNYRESNKYILSFDDPNAKVLENAISLDIANDGKIYLGYYVTDVDSYIEKDSELEKYIYENAMTIRSFPMLPKELRNKISLKEGKRNYVIAYLFEFDSSLNVVNFKVERQNIKVKHCLKFSDVKKIMAYPVSTKLKRTVTNMFTFGKYIYSNREEKKNYHEIKEISKEILYNDIYTEKNRGAKMMSDYQIFLNSFISNYCNHNNLPYLYRNNEFNRSVELIDAIKEKYQDRTDLQDILSFVYAVYEPSTYSTINKGHAGLNLESYGEVSKPARTYASLTNQRLINMYFIDGVILTDEKREKLTNELNKICDHLNKKRVLYDNYTHEVNKIMQKKKNGV